MVNPHSPENGDGFQRMGRTSGSNAINQEFLVRESPFPEHGSHGDHVTVACIGCDATAVWPHVECEVVTSVFHGCATKSLIIVSSACAEVPDNALHEQRLTKFK
jgi:hypothetical protein